MTASLRAGLAGGLAVLALLVVVGGRPRATGDGGGAAEASKPRPAKSAAKSRAAAGDSKSGAVAGDSKSRAAAPTLTADDISLDVSPAAQVLAIWARGDRRPEAAHGVATGSAYRTLQATLTQQTGCPTTLLELERALANPDSGVCGFGLHPAWEARASLDSLVRAIRADSAGIAMRLARRAGAYLPGAASLVRCRFLLASQYTFDALTIDAPVWSKAAPVVIVNLTDVLPYAGDTRGRVASLEHILAHEAFHSVLHQMRRSKPGWRGFSGEGVPAIRHVAEVMLDEGVAHYVDWKDRPGSDTLFTARPGPRETFAFSQLALACRRFRETPAGSAQWWETLQLASSGPLWSKYGAVSGMFAAFRIERAAGRDSLAWAVGAGPGEFLRLYLEAAAADTSLKALPRDLAGLQ